MMTPRVREIVRRSLLHLAALLASASVAALILHRPGAALALSACALVAVLTVALLRLSS